MKTPTPSVTATLPVDVTVKSSSGKTQKHEHDHQHHHSDYSRSNAGSISADPITADLPPPGSTTEGTVIREEHTKIVETDIVVKEGKGKGKKKKGKGKQEDIVVADPPGAAAGDTGVHAATILIKDSGEALVVEDPPTIPPPPSRAPTIITRPPSPSQSIKSIRSHHSHHSRHFPEITVNVTIPQAALAPPPPTLPIPDIGKALTPTPTRAPSLADTPKASEMKLPSLFRKSSQETVKDDGGEEEVVEKVVTTTTKTTTTRPISPPQLIEPDPAEPVVPLPPPPSSNGRTKSVAPKEVAPIDDEPQQEVIETTTVETITTRHPAGNGTVPSGKSGKEGRKGGLKPIPMVDYKALIQHTPPPKEPKRLHPPPPMTVATITAEIEKGPDGKDHIHARVHEHLQNTSPPSTYGIPPPTLAPTVAATQRKGSGKTVAPPPTITGTIMPKSAMKGLPSRSPALELDMDTDEQDEDDRLTRRGRRDKDKNRRHGKSRDRRDREEIYHSLDDAVPAPRSERYAYPPPPTEIEQAAKNRYEARFNTPANQGQGGFGNGWGSQGYIPQPQLFPRPPPFFAPRPPMFAPMMGMNPMMMNPMMMNPMMGMGMGMMGGMMPGMGMMPMGVPGVVPGMPGMGMYNSMPGRFGRDMLGRDFAGPGGVGSSQPYRPPDPSALPPMPFGLPFVARPGQEGFDQYGRQIPPELPEGWDGWGRPIVSSGIPQAPIPVPVQPEPFPPGPQALDPLGAPPPAPEPTTTATRDMRFSSNRDQRGMNGGDSQSLSLTPSMSGTRTMGRTMTGTMTGGGTGRPEQYVGWRSYYS